MAHVCDDDLPRAVDLLARSDLAVTALDRVVPLEEIVSEGLEPLAGGRIDGKVLVAPTP